MRAFVLASLLALIGGCAELPAVGADRCGNSVVEPGSAEECDGTTGCGVAGTPNQCLLVCEAGAACPAGWSCGVDQRCREPTETFTLSAVVPFGSTGVIAADMDSDGISDLLGNDSLGMIIRFGDLDGTLAAQTRVPLPAAGAAPVVLDADENGAGDLALPLGTNGLALFVGDGARGLFPAAQTTVDLPDDGNGCGQLAAAGLQSSLAAPKVLIELGGFAVGFADHPEACLNDPDADCVISATGGELVGGSMPVAALGYGPTDGVQPGDQFAAALIGSNVVSVWGEDANAPRPKRLGKWTLPSTISPGGHLWFGRIDADPCTDLVVDTGTALVVVYNKLGGAGCQGLDAVATVYGHPIGEFLGIGDIDHDGQDELLHTFNVGPLNAQVAIYAREPDGTPGSMTSKEIGLTVTGTPTSATVVDENGDGWKDVVVTLDGATTLDFYLNYVGITFNDFPADLGGNALHVEAGDYDGDLRGDVAVTVADPINPGGKDSLLLFYGGSDARPTPQFLGQFVPEAQPVRFPGGLQPGTDSLLIVSNQQPSGPTACDRRLSVLIGDTSRQMVSLYILLEGQGVGANPIVPLALADVSSSVGAGLLVLGALVPTDGVTPPTANVSVLGFDGTAFGITSQLDVPLSQLDPVTLQGARIATGQLDDDATGVPEAVAVTSAQAMVVSVSGGTVVLADIGKDLGVPAWLELLDMDADGDLDAVGASGILSDADPAAASGPASRLWIAWNEGGTLDFAAPTVLTIPGARHCVDAAAVRSRADAVPRLVVLCYRVDAAVGFVDPEILIGSYPGQRSATSLGDLAAITTDVRGVGVEVADFTGDGLDDIASVGATTTGLFRQCTTDDPADCAAPEAP